MFQRGNRKASKLTGEQVLEIRELYAQPGISQPMLARKFGVSKNTIADIVNGVSWQNVAYQTVVSRPPINRQTPTAAMMPTDEELAHKLQERLEQPVSKPAWNEEPEHEMSDATAEKFLKALAGVKPTLGQKVKDELDKLEKGD